MARPFNWRGVAKAVVEASLLPVASLRLALTDPGTVILAYHNVVPDAEAGLGDSSLHLPESAFRAQMEALQRTHHVISLRDIDSTGDRSRPRAVITFDDAYVGAMRYGLAELAKRRLPSTVFVAPGLCGQLTWWDRLSEPALGSVPAAVRDRALQDFGGVGTAIMAAFPSGETNLPPAYRVASAEEIRAAGTDGLVSFGAHTFNHVNLAATSPDDIARELNQSREWLGALGEAAIPWLAYPYGLFGPDAVDVTKRAGFVGALRTSGGIVKSVDLRMDSRFAAPRLNVPAGLSHAGFRLRIAGLLD
jgi:peptidoglycan/xylan/chitin deacetylase (PgdA/CDA1 family)